jgi:hypothetical protein
VSGGGMKVAVIKTRTIRTRRTIVSFTEEKNDHRGFDFFGNGDSPYLPQLLLIII